MMPPISAPISVPRPVPKSSAISAEAAEYAEQHAQRDADETEIVDDLDEPLAHQLVEVQELVDDIHVCPFRS